METKSPEPSADFTVVTASLTPVGPGRLPGAFTERLRTLLTRSHVVRGWGVQEFVPVQDVGRACPGLRMAVLDDPQLASGFGFGLSPVASR
jgi:hypothetical protein